MSYAFKSACASTYTHIYWCVCVCVSMSYFNMPSGLFVAVAVVLVAARSFKCLHLQQACRRLPRHVDVADALAKKNKQKQQQILRQCCK